MNANLSIGKIRSFQLCTSTSGTFTCLALDHRQNLMKANPVFNSPTELSRFKLELVEKLGSYATSVLLDPEYSAAQAIAKGVLPTDRGWIVALESTGYSGNTYNRQTRILPGWNVEKVKRMGASMAKLLIYYHPDSSVASLQEALVVRIAEECRNHDLGFLLEILTYPVLESGRFAHGKGSVILDSIKKLGNIPGVDLLKVEFPSEQEEQDLVTMQNACLEISKSIKIPWILLSAAVSYEQFFQQAKIACKAGASGVAVGRAVWQEAIHMQAEEQQEFLMGEAKDRLTKLQEICGAMGKPWTDFYTGTVDNNWYRIY
jgi:tagatose 1,6-diphosphate aldolase